MSAAYGGFGPAVTYEATATFDFSTPVEALDLKLLSDNFAESAAGIAFDSLDLQIVVNDGTPHAYSFSSLTGSGGAATFFASGHLISLGAIGAAGQPVEIEYFLDYNSGTSAAVGDGFGFTCDLVDPRSPTAAIPEPSSWAMLLIGFASLAKPVIGPRAGARRLQPRRLRRLRRTNRRDHAIPAPRSNWREKSI